ncbi:GGDEF/response regulator receiver domain protein [Microcystis aeruginosa NIES-2549]|uniref:GGDEF/response regulator receiver domain protein n=2 Tax=Microcystis aeruginosa TaxID=1126 RepID=A0A0F6U0W2_MICAE|nr:diguanylate cyclase [Microcystis aeruginosa]AKE62722.1 GGDEF/response regulator receiver domain protein [Microcystis aeruginosa NIES-2549]AOC51112.1 GGDEF/response regulator receiver domain protein [Microcystis aeruginosa NIES-2481]GCL46149.1 two-component response regulator [Microcystis aeruginosa NIES-3787]
MIKFRPQDCLVLVVDDVSKNLELAVEILDSAGYETACASSFQQAIERVKTANPDLILLDLIMPKKRGLELCRRLKSDNLYAHIPIIFVTDSKEKEDIINAFNSGALDYITKPFHSWELLARVKIHLELKKTQEELKNINSQLEKLVRTDSLTGVNNRREILALGEKEWQRCHRYHRYFSVLVIDIDHFKHINDTFGHVLGDKTLITIAGAIKNCLRQVDSFGRFGGEEFVAILPETNLEDAGTLARRICQVINQLNLEIDRQKVRVTASIGVATFSPQDNNLETVIERADRAMFAAKNQGRNRVSLGKTV